MSSSSSNLSAEDCHLSVSWQDIYFDSNAQFPSPDHVFAETPAYMYTSFTPSPTPSPPPSRKVNAGIQTNVSFSNILLEQMQTDLDAYSISPEGNESKAVACSACSEVVKNDQDDFNYFLQQLIKTYLPLSLFNEPEDFDIALEKTSSEELMNIDDNELLKLQLSLINFPSQPYFSCHNELACESKSDEATNNFDLDDIELVEPQPIPVSLPSPPSSDCDSELGTDPKMSDEESYNFDDIELVEPQPIPAGSPLPPSSVSDSELACEPKKSDEESCNFDDITLVEPQSIPVGPPSPPPSDCDSE